jgi:hypothetical protein
MSKVVSFDCKQFPGRPFQRKKDPVTEQAAPYQPKLTNLSNSKNRAEFMSQVRDTIDQLRVNSLHGKDRRRLKEYLDLKAGVIKAQKPPRVPAKILVGMRAKAKKRDQKAREDLRRNGDHHLVSELVSDKIRPPKERYELREKEKNALKERERGLMLSHALKARQGQKPKPFRPPK